LKRRWRQRPIISINWIVLSSESGDTPARKGEPN
jgi:hypothetical protein